MKNENKKLFNSSFNEMIVCYKKYLRIWVQKHISQIFKPSGYGVASNATHNPKTLPCEKESETKIDGEGRHKMVECEMAMRDGTVRREMKT
jgi:hypothetical protein